MSSFDPTSPSDPTAPREQKSPVAPPASSGAWALPDSAVEQPSLRSPGDHAAEHGRTDPLDRTGGDARESPRGAFRLPIPLRPMTQIDKLDGGFAVVKSHPRAVLTLSAVIVLPAQLLAAFLARGTASFGDTFSQLSDAFSTPSTPASPASQFEGLAGVYAGAAVEAFAAMLLGAAVGYLVSGWYAGEERTPSDVLRMVVRRSPTLAALWLLLLPLKVVGYAFCFVPLFGVLAVFVIAGPVVGIEGLGPIRAISRCWQLSTRRFLPAVGLVALTVLVEQLITPLLAAVPELVSFLVPEDWRWILQGVGRGLTSLLIVPFSAGVATLQYLDLRVRTEGLDLDLDARRELPEPAYG